MAAPNAQPFGSRGTAATPNEHAPVEGGKPADSKLDTGNSRGPALPAHGTPAPVGNGKSNPLK
jgi:hypothetical protein